MRAMLPHEVETQVTAIGHVIQLSVAPVFLLSGVAGILAVMTSRLGRVVDRARQKEALAATSSGAATTRLTDELATLSRRAALIYRGITLCTVAAILVCGVVIAQFVGAFFAVDSSLTVALLFVLAMISFIGGLLVLLREVFLATRSLRIGHPQ